jgi:hypothetical protein
VYNPKIKRQIARSIAGTGDVSVPTNRDRPAHTCIGIGADLQK